MDLWQHLSGQISRHNGSDFHISHHTSLSGGCINSAYRVSDGNTHYFVKLNGIDHRSMFKSEALALQELHQLAAVRVPQAICFGEYKSQAYLVLEHLSLSGRPNASLLGRQLAATHQVSAQQFGWHTENVIGSTPQANQQNSDWIAFWRQQRLIPQLKLAEQNGYGRALALLNDKLLSDFEGLFADYRPVPSLLHGDLWGGNVAGLADGTPVMFDPALYYGDREADIAMTYLFGGFDSQFYATYNEAWPLDAGFAQRKTFYNLYHILNHLNLFGTGYLTQAVSMTEQILAEI